MWWAKARTSLDFHSALTVCNTRHCRCIDQHLQNQVQFLQQTKMVAPRGERNVKLLHWSGAMIYSFIDWLEVFTIEGRWTRDFNKVSVLMLCCLSILWLCQLIYTKSERMCTGEQETLQTEWRWIVECSQPEPNDTDGSRSIWKIIPSENPSILGKFRIELAV